MRMLQNTYVRITGNIFGTIKHMKLIKVYQQNFIKPSKIASYSLFNVLSTSNT